MVSFYIFELIFWPTAVYALACGGWSERAALIILAVAFTISPLVTMDTALPFDRLEAGILAVSCGSFVSLLFVAMRSEKFWPLWLAALQGQVVISHVAPLLNDQVNGWTYQLANQGWSYLQLLLVALATWEHRRFWARRHAGDISRPSFVSWSRRKRNTAPPS